MVTKKCARSSCGRAFEEEEGSPFITCPTCRKPLPDEPGGCTRYKFVNSKHAALEKSEEYAGKQFRDLRYPGITFPVFPFP